jgi:hypothetical protein
LGPLQNRLLELKKKMSNVFSTNEREDLIYILFGFSQSFHSVVSDTLSVIIAS